MKWRRWAAVLVVVVLLISGCVETEEEDPIELYRKLALKYDELDNVRLLYSIDFGSSLSQFLGSMSTEVVKLNGVERSVVNMMSFGMPYVSTPYVAVTYKKGNVTVRCEEKMGEIDCGLIANLLNI